MFRSASAGFLALLAVSGCGDGASLGEPAESPSEVATAKDPADATYRIEATAIRLRDGQASTPAAPGAAELAETRLFGPPTWGDLDGDGDEDAAVVLLHRTGGSGTFYYVAAALSQDEGFSGTNAIFLGDRIAPQSIQVRKGALVANFADRRPGEAMATAPTEARTKYLTLQSGRLVEAPPLGEGM
jgi:hypothetical protein